MAEFSAGAAIGSGLKLIGQKPVSVLTWGLAYVAISLVPLLALFWSFIPDLLAYNSRMMAGVAARDAGMMRDPELIRIATRLAPLQLAQLALTLLAAVVVSSAVYRAVLEPERRGFAYLRLGVQELWVLVSMVAYFLLIVAVGVISSSVVAAVAPALGGSWGGGLAVFLLGCGAIALVIWVGLRLSMAVPMSFMERRLRLTPSWALTQGQGWRLFAVAVALAVMILAVETVVVVIGGALGGEFTLARLDEVRAFFAHPPADAVARAAPVIAGLALTQIVLSGLSFALWTAPFAEIYRELSKPRIEGPKVAGPVKIKT